MGVSLDLFALYFFVVNANGKLALYVFNTHAKVKTAFNVFYGHDFCRGINAYIGAIAYIKHKGALAALRFNETVFFKTLVHLTYRVVVYFNIGS